MLQGPLGPSLQVRCVDELHMQVDTDYVVSTDCDFLTTRQVASGSIQGMHCCKAISLCSEVTVSFLATVILS